MDGFCVLLRSGFKECILHTLRLEPGGLLTLGPPCGSFVWINRATSGRSSTCPYGNEDRAYVELASLTLISELDFLSSVDLKHAELLSRTRIRYSFNLTWYVT